MCPFGYGEIHTSRQAGGIASDLILAISSASEMRAPVWSKNVQPDPARRRVRPGVRGETVRRRGMAEKFPEGPVACLTGCGDVHHAAVTRWPGASEWGDDGHPSEQRNGPRR